MSPSPSRNDERIGPFETVVKGPERKTGPRSQALAYERGGDMTVAATGRRRAATGALSAPWRTESVRRDVASSVRHRLEFN